MTKVSVVMPVYNGARFLQESIESILDQTFKDIEFLIVNDGSTDQSEEIIMEYAKIDDRINLITNPENLGIAEATNLGIAHARGEYIALMDQDDISMPERLEKQVVFLDTHPEISVVGANSIRLDEDGEQHFRQDVLETPGLIRWGLLFRDQIQNPTALMTRTLFSIQGYKYEDFMPSQDYRLWLKISQRFKLANLPDYLLVHRVHKTNASINFGHLRLSKIREMRKEFVNQLLDLDITEEVAAGLSDLSFINAIEDARMVSKIYIKWLKLNLVGALRDEKTYMRKKTRRALKNIWHYRSRDPRILPYILLSYFL